MKVSLKSIALAFVASLATAGAAHAASTTFASFSAASVPNFAFSTGGAVGTPASLVFTQTVNVTLSTGFFDGFAPGSDYILVPQQEFLGATISLTGFSAGAITDASPLTESIPETTPGTGTITVKSASGRTIFAGTVTDLNVVYFGSTQGGVNTVTGIVNYNTGDLSPVLALPEDFTFNLNNVNFPGGGGAVGAGVINNFTATATGSFDSDSSGGTVGTPLPAAFGPSMLVLGAVGALMQMRRKAAC